MILTGGVEGNNMVANLHVGDALADRLDLCGPQHIVPGQSRRRATHNSSTLVAENHGEGTLPK